MNSAEDSGRYNRAYNGIALSVLLLYFHGVKTLRYVYWQDGDMWLGHLEEFPDYMTQGETLEELQENLRDIYEELSGGHIPCVRHVAELQVT